jgi:hypothetical protein
VVGVGVGISICARTGAALINPEASTPAATNAKKRRGIGANIPQPREKYVVPKDRQNNSVNDSL